MPRGDVARLHQRDREPAGRRVQRDADAGDAAADDEQVEPLRLRSAASACGARGGPERAVAHARLRPHVHLDGLPPARPLALAAGCVQRRLDPTGHECPAAPASSSPTASAASAAMPRAVASSSAETSSTTPDRSATACSSARVGRQPAADPDRRRCGQRRPGPRARRRSGGRRRPAQARGDVVAAVVALLAPTIVIAVGAVPVRRAQAGRRGHDDRVRPAPVGRPVSALPGQQARSRAARARRVARVGAERLERIGAPAARGLPGGGREHPGRGWAGRGRRSATRTRRCRA